MKKLILTSSYHPIESQRQTIDSLADNFMAGKKHQVLLGVTGSGKTYIAGKLIEKLNLPTLIISHNKTLAGQIFQEMRDFFPENSVNYFVSYYDYYQPEAYIPSTDTYIEKDSSINELIDQLRLATTSNILSRNDVIVVASVSCIYNIGSPDDYQNFIYKLNIHKPISRDAVLAVLLELLYERNDFAFTRGTFRIRSQQIDVNLSYLDEAIRLNFNDQNVLNKISFFDPKTGETTLSDLEEVDIFPTKHFMTQRIKDSSVTETILSDMRKRKKYFLKHKKLIEAQRIEQKVELDLELLRETGYVKGIENYSRYFDNREPGDPPYSLVDYFNKAYGDEWLLVVDESHITFPQIRGMYAGDRSRKETLVEYGFRLPSAFDNRPLKFDEFLNKIKNFIALSATPDEWEIDYANDTIVEQLVRPTGIVEPEIKIRPIENQVKDSISLINERVKKGQRVLITTLTKKTAEDLSHHLLKNNIKAAYLHADIKTLERAKILEELRDGKYDCLVGINLLREGLDLPEVSLVLILDADKEGFLRSYTSLIQTMGRAARHIDGTVVMFADKITGSMERAMNEIKRRREIQVKANLKNGIIPSSVNKPIRKQLVVNYDEPEDPQNNPHTKMVDAMTPMEKKSYLKILRSEMRLAAKNLDFESAILLRNRIDEVVQS